MQADGKIEWIMGPHVMRHCLVRLHATIPHRVAVARRNHGGNEQPRPALLHLQQLRITQDDDTFFARSQVAEIETVTVIDTVYMIDSIMFYLTEIVFVKCTNFINFY